jgi:hypothetical protein
MWLATARPGRRFGKPRRVPGAADQYYRTPEIALSPRGDVMLAWNYFDHFREPDPDIDLRDEGCCYGYRAVIKPARGRFGPRFALAPRGRETSFGGMVIRSPSRFYVAFSARSEVGRRGGVYLRSAAGRRRVGRAEQVVAAPAAEALDLSIVRGRPRILLTRRYAAPVLESVRLRARRYSRPRRVLGTIERVEPLRFLTDRHGGQAVVSGDYVYTRRRGRPFRRQRLARRPFEASYLHLAMARSGASAVVWSMPDRTVRISTRRPDGRFRKPRVLWRAPRYLQPNAPQVAVDSRGRASVIWEVDSRTTRSPRLLLVATVKSSGRRHDVRRLDSQGYLFTDPLVTRDDRGRSTAVWNRSSRLWASYGP